MNSQVDLNVVIDSRISLEGGNPIANSKFCSIIIIILGSGTLEDNH
jgi:hypothetical protein